MSAGHLVGFFAISREGISETEALFQRAGAALDELQEGHDELLNDTYRTARKYSVFYRELHETVDTNALTSFETYMTRALKSHRDWGVYAPQAVKRLDGELLAHENKLGDEEAVVRQIWNEDHDVSVDGIRNYYRAYKEVVSVAAEQGCAFAKALLG